LTFLLSRYFVYSMSTTNTIVVHAVGMTHTHYQFHETDLLALVHEPTNSVDPFAVKVVRTDHVEECSHEFRQVAYIGKEFRVSVLSIMSTIVGVQYKKDHSTRYKAVLEITFNVDQTIPKFVGAIMEASDAKIAALEARLIIYKHELEFK
jgi:hypothetical protein